jgi:hypothetical protein
VPISGIRHSFQRPHAFAFEGWDFDTQAGSLILAVLGSIRSQRKISLFPECSHEAGPCTHPAEFAPGLGAKFSQIARANVGQALPLRMTPEVFHRVELRCVSGQLGELDPPWMPLGVGLHLPAPVHRETVPDDKQRTADLAAELSEELRGLWPPVQRQSFYPGKIIVVIPVDLKTGRFTWVSERC